MKFKFGSIISDGSGKLGGQVYTKNRSGNIIKTKVTPFNPASSAQSFVRNNKALVVSAWQGLSDTDRSLWIKFSEFHPQKDRFGQIHYLSGYGIFTKCNMVRLNLGYTLLYQPVELTPFDNWEVLDIQSFSLNPSIWLFLRPSIAPDFIIQIYATPVLSPGVNYFHGQFRLIGVLGSGQSFPVNLYSLWFAKFGGILTTGYAIAFKIAIIDSSSGFISHSVKFKSIIQEGYSASVGGAWSSLGQQFSQTAIFCISSYNQSVLLAGTGTSGKILRSVNGGISWSDLGQQFLQSQILCFCWLSDSIVLAGTGPSGKILRSVNSGISWSDIGTQFSQGTIRSLCYLGNNIVLAGTGAGGLILRSIDGGLTWSSLGQQFSQTAYAVLCSLGNGIVLAGSVSGGLIIRSSDYGLTWSSSGQLFGQSQFWGLCYLGHGIVLAGSQNSGYILRSIDYGLTWSFIDLSIGEFKIAWLSYAGDGFVLAGTGAHGFIIRSFDYGLTWSSSGQLFGQDTIRYIHLVDGVRFLAGTQSGGLVLYSNL